MVRIVLGRLVSLPAMAAGVIVFLFILTNLVPSDPARIAVGPNASDAAVETMRERMGLNDSIFVQFGRYVSHVLQGDLGKSIYDKRPVTASIRAYAPATIELALAATIVTVVLGLSLGIYSAVAKGRIGDRLVRVVSTIGRAMPAFWLALLLQVIFYGRLKWLPSGGRIDLDAVGPPKTMTGLYTVDSVLTGNWAALESTLTHLTLPVAALAIGGIADVMRMTRAQMLLEMRSDYARTARAKGLRNRAILIRHMLPNAMNPVLTVIGVRTGYLLAGTVLIESIFRWPGLGRYSLQAIGNFDFPALTGVTLFVTLAFVLVNLFVDLIQVTFDPRARSAP
jgi:ABC-type dipeptide/oligopeptide/nickel transport system permease component